MGKGICHDTTYLSDKKEGKQYASLCVELDIASCGKSKKEVFDGLEDAAFSRAH